MVHADLQQEYVLAEFYQLGAQLGLEVFQLWVDAIEFWTKASGKKVGAQRKASLMRAAVIMAAAAFEGWTNFLAAKVVQDGQVAGRAVTEGEADCLCERKRVLDDEGHVKDRKCMYRSRDRFLLLFRLLNGGHDLDHSLRSRLDSSFEIRDSVVHPKPGKSLDLLGSGRGSNAVAGLLAVDISLAKAWVKAKSFRSGPILVRS